MASILQKTLNLLLGCLFHEKCRGCGASGTALCDACEAKIRPAALYCFACRKDFSSGLCPACARLFDIAPIKVYWSVSYQNAAVKTLLQDLKYKSAASLSDILGGILYGSVRNALGNLQINNAIILPVPITARRLRERGFNQAELLAKYISKKTGLPMDGSILLKIKNTSSQVEVAERSLRLENLRGSFAVPDPQKIAGKTAILVDDILTTGATIIECSRELKKAGAKNIIALVVAH